MGKFHDKYPDLPKPLPDTARYLPNGLIIEPPWPWITKEVISWRDKFIALFQSNPQPPDNLWTVGQPFNLHKFQGFGRFLAWHRATVK